MGTSVDTRSPSDGYVSFDNYSRYDVALAALPLPLLFGLIGGTMTSIQPAMGAGLGGLPSIVFLWYLLFVDSPLPDEESEKASRPGVTARSVSGRRRRRPSPG